MSLMSPNASAKLLFSLVWRRGRDSNPRDAIALSDCRLFHGPTVVHELAERHALRGAGATHYPALTPRGDFLKGNGLHESYDQLKGSALFVVRDCRQLLPPMPPMIQISH